VTTAIASPNATSLLDRQDDMPLNETDKAWIRETINASHKRKGLGRFAGFLKDWGGVLGIGALTVFVFSQWSAYIEFRTKTNSDLDLINKSLARIDPNFAAYELTQIDHVDQKTIQQAQQIIKTAKADGRPISPQIIAEMGKKFISASGKNPDAWNVALDLADYRSSLNENPTSEPARALQVNHPDQIKWTGTTSPDRYLLMLRAQFAGIYFLPYVVHAEQMPNPLASAPKLFLFGEASETQAAAIGSETDVISNGDTLEKREIFSQYIGVQTAPGTTIFLDGLRLKNVIFVNSQIGYDGDKPLMLENVYFVNCTFTGKQNPQGERFLDAALSPSPSVTLSGE
jgi:hypothetical protein